MRKEVKRSLIIWPAVASAAIGLISTATTIQVEGLRDGLAQARLAVSEFTQTRLARNILVPNGVATSPIVADAMHTDLTTAWAPVAGSERVEVGNRAMQKPPRLSLDAIVTTTQYYEPLRNEANQFSRRMLGSAKELATIAYSQTREMFESQIVIPMRAANSQQPIKPKSMLPASIANLGDRSFASKASSFPSERPNEKLLIPQFPPEQALIAGGDQSSNELSPSALRSPANGEFVLPMIDGDSATPPTIDEHDSHVIHRSLQTNPAGWPKTSSLDDRLAKLSDGPAGDWSHDVSQHLEELRSLSRMGEFRAGILVDELKALADAGRTAAENVADQDEKRSWLLAAHALTRRTDVWQSVWRITSSISNDLSANDRFSDDTPAATKEVVDYASLMTQIEATENDSLDLGSDQISTAIQILKVSDNIDAIELARSLDQHYRNANVRTAISRAMIERFLPKIDPQTVPVRTQILGRPVRGVSQIQSKLAVQLIPTADSWKFQLQTNGRAQTRSTGFSGSVSVHTMGNAQFKATTPIQLTPSAVDVGHARVDVHGKSKLRSVRSDFDGWPIVGPLVRNIAESRYHAVANESNRVANRKMRSQMSSEIDARLQERVEIATERLDSKLFSPFSQLQLAPRVVDMQTTDQRLVGRYRLAGESQLAAVTPRPRAPRSSLMSIQVHQSAINNTIEGIVPQYETRTVHDIIENGMQVFGATIDSLTDDYPHDVELQFTKKFPVTIEFRDDRIWLTFRIQKLTQDDQLDLRRFIVEAVYRPEVDGGTVSLVREGPLRISGPGMSMRERLPIRAIFTKVLAQDRTIDLAIPTAADPSILDGLVISQFELRDGWIGIAISEQNTPKIARR